MSGFDHHITIFSPHGHLYQVEYALKAATSGGNTAIAVRGQESACFISQKKIPDRLIDPTSMSNAYQITDTIGVVMLGLIRKCYILLYYINYLLIIIIISSGYSCSSTTIKI
jgi:20S proteasome subunit alpha 1